MEADFSQQNSSVTAQIMASSVVHQAPPMPSKPKKGVKRKADTTTPVITTVAGKLPEPMSPEQRPESPDNNIEHVLSPMSNNVSGDMNDLNVSGEMVGGKVLIRTPSVRREGSGRTIRPPRSRDLDSEENVSVFLIRHRNSPDLEIRDALNCKFT